jgi:peptidyl-prolyl cis-trans isomerase SurA
MAVAAMLLAGLAGACQRSTAPADPGPDVWAVVNGRQIARADVDKAYRGMVMSAPTAPSVEEMLNLKLNIVDELITQDLLLARAQELGVAATDVEIDNALAEQKRSMSEEDFQKQLTARGLVLDDVRNGLRREISAQKLIEREIVSKITISDDDIAAFYNANRAQFNLTEPHYRLAQILVTPQRDPQLQNRQNDDAATAEAARQKAQMLTERLSAGADFAALAMDFSEDPQTVAQGGDLGLVPESALANLPPALRSAVQRLQPGTASTLSIGPNYVIVMLVAREPAGQRDLGTATVRDGIRDLLRTRREQLLHQAYLMSIRDSADITNYLARRAVDTQGRIPGQTADVTQPNAAPPAAAPAAAQ